MQIRNLIALVAVVAAALVLASCGTTGKRAYFGAHDAPRHFFFACDSSPFKDQVRKELIGKYMATTQIEVAPVGHLRNIDPDDYDLVLVIDSCLAWTGFNPSLNRFLEQNSAKDNIVVFMTAGDPDWQFPDSEVDAVTSASNVENVDAIVDQIAMKIDAKVPGGRENHQ